MICNPSREKGLMGIEKSIKPGQSTRSPLSHLGRADPSKGVIVWEWVNMNMSKKLCHLVKS